MVTSFLLISGLFIIYGLEHQGHLVKYDLKTQYLSAFFQSVTLRTAGFNTLDIGNLKISTYLIMILFMFIGAASGSTGGGVKVNTVSVIFAYVRSIFKNQDTPVIMKHSISKNLVNKAFLIILMGIIIIFCGTLILSLFENFSFIKILFEVVSAFGTVGLSTGITGALSIGGKGTIIIIMFMGRLGPLTIMAALSQKKSKYQLYYSRAVINIG